jgi:hypothetical protein
MVNNKIKVVNYRATDRTGGTNIGEAFRFRLQDLLKIIARNCFPRQIPAINLTINGKQ